MDLIFFIEASSEMALILILFHKRGILVNAFEVFDHTEFSTFVDLFVVFNKFTHYFFICDLFYYILRN